MAEIVLSAVINKAADIAGNLAVEEGTRLYWLSEDINWIEGEMRQIQAYLKDVDSKQQQVAPSQGMTTLNQKIRDIAYDVEDILDTFLPQMASYDNRSTTGILSYYFGRATSVICYCFIAHKFSMEIAKIRKRIEDIDRPKATYDITAYKDGSTEKVTWDSRRPRLYADEPAITGFDKDIMRLTDKLLDREFKFNIISIVGMGGLGKTTLAVKLFKSTKQEFQCSALVYVSQQPNMKEILYDIGWQVGLPKKQLEEKLEDNLIEFLRQKRYVIVFDDVWDTKTWDALKISIPINSSNGSRVIVTSRESDVGRYIGGESSLHELQPLDPKSSWQLFCKMVREPLEYTNETSCLRSELEDIGEKIVERCGGVPLAIVVTAGLLRGRERRNDRWNEVLKSMGSHQDDAISNTLALSYKDLLIELKPCFLYFGLFPEDYDVFAFQLINMWVAEKFINVVGSQTLEEVGEAYLNNLIARNLIQVASREADGRIRSCRIQDLLRTLCNSMAKENYFYDTCNNLTSISAARVRRLTTHGRGGISEWAHQTPKLHSFLFFDGNDCLSMKQVKNLCKTSRFLRVLSVDIVGGI